MFLDPHQIADAAVAGLDVERQPLQLARGAVVLEENRLAAHDLDQGFENLGFEPFHSRGSYLHDHGRTVAIDDETGESI